jgi:hypothetical protein
MQKKTLTFILFSIHTLRLISLLSLALDCCHPLQCTAPDLRRQREAGGREPRDAHDPGGGIVPLCRRWRRWGQ